MCIYIYIYVDYLSIYLSISSHFLSSEARAGKGYKTPENKNKSCLVYVLFCVSLLGFVFIYLV